MSVHQLASTPDQEKQMKCPGWLAEVLAKLGQSNSNSSPPPTSQNATQLTGGESKQAFRQLY